MDLEVTIKSIQNIDNQNLRKIKRYLKFVKQRLISFLRARSATYLKTNVVHITNKKLVTTEKVGTEKKSEYSIGG